MSTINNKNLIDNLIKNNGYYEDDPRVAIVTEYTTVWGNKVYGVTWVNESLERQLRYTIKSRYILNPKVIWRANEATN